LATIATTTGKIKKKLMGEAEPLTRTQYDALERKERISLIRRLTLA
jgi:hypothetical protein